MKVIDSHTGGEPTRVIIEGGPDLGEGDLTERLKRMSEKYDHIRQSVILEPRGSDVWVGALLCPPVDKSCTTGVIFFNNSGYLGMCGHGTIGVAVTLAHMGLVKGFESGPVKIKIETPVGIVEVTMPDLNTASVQNVASYLYKEKVEIEVEELGSITGDVAWGGNWFFLADKAPVAITLANEAKLNHYAKAIKATLSANGITGRDGAEIDHIEFFSEAEQTGADSKNYVLCPGNAYDRSPCGTGTSAKIASLATKGLLKPGQIWVQDSIINSRFEGFYEINQAGEIIPTITGSAYVHAESTLLRHTEDPFRNGIL